MYSTGKSENVQVQVLDINGRTVLYLQQQGNAIENLWIIPSKKLVPGLYTIKLSGSNRVLTEKLIIR